MPSVFYAICPGTGGTDDKKTGSPTITIASGVATLNVTQTGNIGQGFRITYDTSKVCFISQVNSATSFNVITATGGTPSDESTPVTVNSITADYASLSAAEAGASDANHLNTSDLVTGTYVLNLACYVGQSEDSSSLTVDGYTTSSDYFVGFYVPTGGTQSLSSNRHLGVLDRTNYYSCRSSVGYVVINNNYTGIDGLQVCSDVSIRVFVNADYCIIKNCIISPDTTTASGYGIRFQGSGRNSCVVYNCIVMTADRCISRYYDGAGGTLYVYNCVVTGAVTAGYADRAGSSMVCSNCVAFNNTDDFAGTFTSISYCASDDVDGTNAIDISPGATESDGWSAAMTDYANGDFSVKDTSSALYNAGTTISGMDSVDIIGTSRPQGASWDIGRLSLWHLPLLIIYRFFTDHKTLF